MKAQILRLLRFRDWTLRVKILAVLLVAGLAVVAHDLGLDFAIGAFAAGMIVGMVTHGPHGEQFRHKLDGLGFGFLIPTFFVPLLLILHLIALIRVGKGMS